MLPSRRVFTTLCTGGTLVLLDEMGPSGCQSAHAVARNMPRIHRLFVPSLDATEPGRRGDRGRDTLPSALRDVITAGEQLRISPEVLRLVRPVAWLPAAQSLWSNG